MFVRIPYFLKQRSRVKRSKVGKLPDKKEAKGLPDDLKYLRSGTAKKRKSKRITGPSFVKACSYQSYERAATTEEEVRARRGTTRKGDAHKMVNAESNEALPCW